MNLYILRWNPNISSYKSEDFLELITHIKNNEQPSDFNWSIREHEKLCKGDMFILQQVGTDHDGIAMIGKFKDECYEEESWRKDGSTLFYADMWIMDAFDCDKENPLPASRYEKLFPEIEWHGGHSGIVVDEESQAVVNAVAQGDKMNLQKIRSAVGMDYKINKQNSVGLAYVLTLNRMEQPHERMHALSASYSYDF